MGPETSGFDMARTASVRGAASAAILAERAWPTLVRLAALVGAFLILAWFGVFAAVPDWLRIGLLGVLGLGALAALWGARRVRLPTRAEVARRVEADSALDHQPLQAQEDRVPAGDDFAAALWHEHQRRMAERLRALRSTGPRTRTYAIDPYGLRAMVALLVVTGFAFSFGPLGGRVADALAPLHTELAAGVRVDAWATPPGYTGRAPILLAADTSAEGPIEVPEGTVLSLRVSDRRGTEATFRPEGGEAAPIAPVVPEGQAPDTAETAEAPVAGEYELPLRESGTARIAGTFRDLGAWRFTVTPDTPPTVAFRGEPKPGRNGSLDLAFAVSDDYGVAAGEAKLATREPVAPGARPLIAPPEPSLSLPRRRVGEAEGRTSLALTDSPYAGTRAALTLTVRDDGGQAGETPPLEVTLPERRFTDPMARAVVEQRRILALDANAAPRVVSMLDAITLRGDEFIANPAHYLALRAVRERIAHAPDDETLVSAVDFLWQIALGIEDGDLGASERKLRDLQEQLSQALENGASDEEIAQLMQELRQAMQEYMQAMAEAMRNMPPQSLSQMGESQEIRPQDLDRMLDRIEDLARSGSKDAAQQLLSELREMMDSLQAMRPNQGQQQSGQQSPMQQQMNQLGEMLQRQQKLMDETFELGRQQMRRQMENERGGEPGQQGRQGQEGQQGQQGQRPPMTEEELRALQERLQAEQGQLQKDLQALREAMEGQGLQPSEDLGQAGESMGRAEGAIGQGDDGEAVGQQGDAMSALRRGAQDAMNQMQAMQGQGEGQQPGQGMQPGGPGRYGEGPGQQRSGRDPLGRERQTQGPDFGQDVGVPDEIDIQRARRILDQIRDRLGRPLSPEQERQYLERLLRTP
ncbi:TIGR02302 family protein [Aureimonas flava]|uniref:TIGR02302 family protein n=1 Tax=Aureimonas flava TaxID=2320271 RepID=A0A3A1WJC1_9HYPH|nr:TIGR02302 family protein [Aureimonas flava]RIX99999.1 TIGR02302 family protein [Aureimonas flava]